MRTDNYYNPGTYLVLLTGSMLEDLALQCLFYTRLIYFCKDHSCDTATAANALINLFDQLRAIRLSQ